MDLGEGSRAGCREKRLIDWGVEEESSVGCQKKRRKGQGGEAVVDFDVFLNHRGPDVKGALVAHLYQALKAEGLNPFLDKYSLAQGSPTFESIKAALGVAKVHVAVVSVGYGESKHCLRELVAMLRSGKPVIPVFYDVEPAQLHRVETGAFQAAFEKHKSRETEDQVREWTDALDKLANITAFVFRLSDYRGDEAELKQELVDAVLRLLPRIRPLQVEKYLVGLEGHLRTCASAVMKMSSKRCLLGLVGMGGIGKSTLARLVYNYLIKKKKFKAASFLQIKVSYKSLMEDIGSGKDQRLLDQLLEDLLCKGERSRAEQRFEVSLDKLKNLGPVLIVFDNIQYLKQLDDLEPIVSALATGSCIIATSRDRHVMKVMAASAEARYVHEVTPLGTQDSQNLLEWHAFQTNEVPENIKALMADVSKAFGGLPLALRVVGRSLHGNTSLKRWEEAMEVLSHRDIMVALKWSYNCLFEPEQLMFVDIAFIFCGWKKDQALLILGSCKDCSSCCGNKTPISSLDILIEKSLVTEDGGVIDMHNLLQELGQHIGEKKGSHLTKGKALKAVNRGWQEVRALEFADTVKMSNVERFKMMPHLDVEKFKRMPQLDVEKFKRMPQLDVEKFKKMPDLHYPVFDGFILYGNCEETFEQVRYLQISNSHYLEERRVLGSYPVRMFLQDFPNLVNLSWTKCESITTGPPDFKGCPNLVTLNLRKCGWMSELPDSIGDLSKLEMLNLEYCVMLERVPDTIGCLTSLRTLDLGNCSKLKNLPDSIGQLTLLKWLYLENSSELKNLPDSIGQLTSLEVLNLGNWSKLQNLPNSISQLTSLWVLGLGNCSKLKNLPDSIGQLTLIWKLDLENCSKLKNLSDSIGQLTSLEVLYLENCSELKNLPNSIGQLTSLRKLNLKNCSKLHNLPDSICQLTLLFNLDLKNCSKLQNLPDSIGQLTWLWELDLENCSKLQNLPDSMGQLTSLWNLHLENCSELKNLSDSIGQLTMLWKLVLGNCSKLQNLPDSIGQLRSLTWLKLVNCSQLMNLPDSIGQLTSLRKLDLENCSKLQNLPDSIGRLTSLKGLHLKNCSKLQNLPDSIGQLTSLLELNLENCSQLNNLPDSIRQLTSL